MADTPDVLAPSEIVPDEERRTEPGHDDGDDSGNEGDPIPVHPLPPPGKLPEDLLPDGTDRNGLGVARFLVELAQPVSTDTVAKGLSAEYVNGKALSLPLDEERGTFLFGVYPDLSEGGTQATRFSVLVAGNLNDDWGNLIILLVKVRAPLMGAPLQIGVAFGKLAPIKVDSAY